MHFDHPIFIVLIVIAALLRWLSKRAESSRRETGGSEPRTAQPSIPQQREVQSDEERVRRFLEALGQPATSKPPPKITPRPAAQKPTVRPRHPLGPALPPLTTRPPSMSPDSPPPVFTAERPTPRQLEKTLRPAATLSQSSTFEVRTVDPTAPADDLPAMPFANLIPAAAPSDSLRSLLRTPNGVRNAILLREILGEPRGLRSLESA